MAKKTESTGDSLERTARIMGAISATIGAIILAFTFYGIFVSGTARIGGMIGNCGLIFGFLFFGAGVNQLRHGLRAE